MAIGTTTSELIKRKALPYLNHELAGYCNRFDRGVVDNCLQFWTQPAREWWSEYEKGDRVRRGSGGPSTKRETG